ncbi:MAG: thiamine diphosphokinase [Candidatus Kapabacteria bacterium]|nr:thiamine diphosphokinase [Candidatus Kapabacteria bacterium]
MIELKHTSTPFDAVICLNGAIPPAEQFEMVMDRPLIAADGAAESLYHLGIVPEFVVGDFDSLSTDALSLLRDSSELVVDVNQETNDFEKALLFAQSMVWDRVLVLGIHGGDLEHTLNNWSVMMRFGRIMNLVALDRERYGIPVYDSFTYAASPNELLSLIPQPHARISTKGLQWGLVDELLELGTREGARNRAGSGAVEVHIHSGALFFFCDAVFPLAPELM